MTIKPVRIEIGKRVTALIIDFAACYLFGAFISLIPIINTFFPLQVTMMLVFLCRDYLFEGRGIGKNLMGLQVVDINSGYPLSLLQSVKRNIVLVAPYLVFVVLDSILRLLPFPTVTMTIIGILNIIGMIYCAIIIPMECYRIYSRADGLRFGDELASTALIEAPMDFSKILPKQ